MSTQTTVRNHHCEPRMFISLIILLVHSKTCCWHCIKQAPYQYTFARDPMDAVTKTILTPIKLKQREQCFSPDDWVHPMSTKLLQIKYSILLLFHIGSNSGPLFLLFDTFIIEHVVVAFACLLLYCPFSTAKSAQFYLFRSPRSINTRAARFLFHMTKKQVETRSQSV